LRASGLRTERSGSTAADMYDVATGKIAAAVAATRKGNLEEVAEHLAVTEAGGVVYTIVSGPNASGRVIWRLHSLHDKRFLTYGQDEHILTVSAASEAVAQSIVARLNTAFTPN